MTEDVLVDTYETVRNKGIEPVNDMTAIHAVLERLASGERIQSLDPEALDMLRKLVARLQGVWGKEGDFLNVGMSPLLQNLFVRFNTGGASA